jgi:hypothetical protein
METIKYKILLEDSIDRTDSSNWGQLTATTFFLKVFLSQNIDDMGIFTDISYISGNTSSSSNIDYTILTNKLTSIGLKFPFMTGATAFNITGDTETDKLTIRFIDKQASDYYNYGNLVITGETNSKIEELKSYNNLKKYIPGFEMIKEDYLNYKNESISGVSMVVSVGEPNVYAFDAINDIKIGTDSQAGGIAYKDYTGITNTFIIDGVRYTIPVTRFNFKGQGRNETNVSLSALTKEEYLFGIISPPEVKNDVFIDRGVTSVLEMHLRLSEIKNLGQLTRYGNGMYNITKQ